MKKVWMNVVGKPATDMLSWLCVGVPDGDRQSLCSPYVAWLSEWPRAVPCAERSERQCVLQLAIDTY